MAYLTFLYSVSQQNITAFCSQRDAMLLKPSKTAVCSHLLASWVEIQPLGQVLGEAIDGGEQLHAELRHPLRPPRFHTSAATRVCHQNLQKAWAIATASEPIEKDDWYAEQISHVLSIFAWADEHGEGIITALEPLPDEGKTTLCLSSL
jgi:hypothetical protein